MYNMANLSFSGTWRLNGMVRMMKQIQEQTALNPLHSHWRLADDRNVLYLSPTGETDTEKTVELSPEQAGRIREITAITSSLLITLLIEKTGYRCAPGRP
ncbi:RNase II stability modulator [Salmonella enterica subsp. enterica]|nr:RNase II stability modulator [Salmonella enterica subsp. enterica]